MNFKQMKNNILIFIILLTSLNLFAQQKDKVIPISIGLYGVYHIQPGIKIGTAFNVKNWKTEKGDETKSRSLLISPQIGAFIRPKNHTSFLLNTDVGYKITTSKHRIYTAPSLGLGYLAVNQILSKTVDLSSGDITAKNREIRHYFLPTINLEWGKVTTKKVGWYTKLSYGRKISSKFEDAAFFSLELGLKFIIQKKTKL